jgi:DNA-binding NarL/FixJ family response regulator
MRKILIVDDHPLIIEAITAVVTAAFPGFSTISATSASELRSLLGNVQANAKIDVAFIDLHLPDADGVDLIKELNDKHDVPVIGLSGQCDSLTIASCMKNGAVGFVQKSSKLTSYVSAMNVVLSGGQYFPVEHINARAVTAASTQIFNTLTDRQRQVLDLIIVGKSNKLIAKHLSLAEGTIRNHASDLIAFFNVNSRTALVFATSKIGYKPRTI